MIEHVNGVNPNQGELFYKQPSLHRVAGPIYCEHLKRVDGLSYETLTRITYC